MLLAFETVASTSRIAREGVSRPFKLTHFLGAPFRFYPSRKKKKFRESPDGSLYAFKDASLLIFFSYPKKISFNDGSLGSRNDEERRETRYVM